MLHDDVAPRSEPLAQRGRDVMAELGGLVHQVPLGGIERARLVEDALRDAQLADVMQQRRPAQPITVTSRGPEPHADEISEGADSLRVTPGTTVVAAEGGNQREDPLSRLLGRLVRVSAAG